MNAKTIKCIVFLCVAGMIGGVSYIKIRHDREIERIRVTCVNNLKWIAGAKDICAQEQRLKPGSPVSNDLVEKYVIDGWPTCPSGGKYTANPIGQNPTCTIPGHTIPP